jgi:hypothetical protein
VTGFRFGWQRQDRLEQLHWQSRSLPGTSINWLIVSLNLLRSSYGWVRTWTGYPRLPGRVSVTFPMRGSPIR